MARGGSTSHVALIASAMGLPALVALGPEVLAVRKGDVVLVDAERGVLSLAPSPESLEASEQERAARKRRAAEDLLAAAAPGHTRDGVHVAVNANLGAADDTVLAIERGADGCGLLRTEFLFLERDTAPGEDEQFAQYRLIADQLAPRPLTIRTMDIGGDKPIPYLPLPPEDKPALGLRGLRTSLAFPDMLRAQLRAILRLRSAQVRILLPMVNDLVELRAARALLRECADDLGIDALPPLGAMIETPASALLATQLLREADFLSIGTNDLSQYTLAIDRGHPELSAKLDALHPAVLRLIASVAAAGEARGREVAVCGGLASDPDAVALLVGLGIRELSAVPGTIPTQKRILRGLDLANCRELARRAMEMEDAGAVRALVANWPGASQQVEVQS
jgi:phosphoenolpyruvate-protein phosphotransferase